MALVVSMKNTFLNMDLLLLQRVCNFVSLVVMCVVRLQERYSILSASIENHLIFMVQKNPLSGNSVLVSIL